MIRGYINSIRNTAEVYVGWAHIGAGLVAGRLRDAAGIPTLRDCEACGGVAYELCITEAGTACISCVEWERRDAEHKAEWLGAKRVALRESLVRVADEVGVRTTPSTSDAFLYNLHVDVARCIKHGRKAYAERATVRAERDDALATLRDAQKSVDVLRAERDSLRQHVALTTRGDGLDDLRVRLANASIDWAEGRVPRDVRWNLFNELSAATSAKQEVTT